MPRRAPRGMCHLGDSPALLCLVDFCRYSYGDGEIGDGHDQGMQITIRI